MTYMQGCLAFLDGKTLKDNMYSTDCPDYEDWKRGYRDAEKHSCTFFEESANLPPRHTTHRELIRRFTKPT